LRVDLGTGLERDCRFIDHADGRQTSDWLVKVSTGDLGRHRSAARTASYNGQLNVVIARHRSQAHKATQAKLVNNPAPIRISGQFCTTRGKIDARDWSSMIRFVSLAKNLGGLKGNRLIANKRPPLT